MNSSVIEFEFISIIDLRIWNVDNLIQTTCIEPGCREFRYKILNHAENNEHFKYGWTYPNDQWQIKFNLLIVKVYAVYTGYHNLPSKYKWDLLKLIHYHQFSSTYMGNFNNVNKPTTINQTWTTFYLNITQNKIISTGSME